MLKNEKPGGETGASVISISEEDNQNSTKKLEIKPVTIDESRLVGTFDLLQVNIKSTKVLDLDMMTDHIAKKQMIDT
jgi:hypothetical protein